MFKFTIVHTEKETIINIEYHVIFYVCLQEKLVDEENEMIYNLRNISSRFEGEYECEAFNKEGQSRSPKLMVNVLRE